MFGRLGKLLDKTKALDRSEILIRIWNDADVQEFIIDLNRIDQLLEKGEDAFSQPIGVYRTDRGERSFKGVSKSKSQGSPYALLDTSDFYRSFDVNVSGDDLVITADDAKGSFNLSDKYGQIIGLTGESKAKLSEKILPLVITEVRRILLT